MDIKELIKREAPEDNKHDNAYSEALRDCYDLYKDMPLETLTELQSAARETYNGNHSTTAACMIISELLKEYKLTKQKFKIPRRIPCSILCMRNLI